LKIARKVLLYLLLTVMVVVTGLTGSVLLFKDRIIQQFIREANKSINTPIKIGKINVSVWQDFPNLAIVFHDVYIEDSHPGTYPLLTAKTVSFSLNALEAWKGRYSIQGLQIDESETNLKINAVGKSNYVIAKEGSSSGGAIRFDLQNVKLKNTRVSYFDQLIHQHHTFNSEKLTASIKAENNVYRIEANGDITTEQIGIKEKIFLRNKRFDVKAFVDYDDGGKNVIIKPSTLTVNKSSFNVEGTYTFKTKNEIDLTTDGKETDIQTILNLFPEEVGKKLEAYKSDGDIFFRLLLKGEMSDRKSPFISVNFGCNDATLFHPEYKSKIAHANLRGTFVSSSITDFRNAELSLKNITGELNDKPFEANLSIDDFENPVVDFHFKGEVDAASIRSFYPLPEFNSLEGEIKADIALTGQIGLLKKKATAQQVKTNGTIELKNIHFNYGKKEIPFQNLNGSLQFTNNDLALSGVSGKFGNSDFLLNGFFKNIVTYLLFENQPIGIETDLKSSFLDLDQLFDIGFGQSSSEEYHFRISPHLHLNFNCDVKAMKYKRFAPRKIKGDLLVKNQMAVSRTISFEAMGGQLSLNGIVDAQKTNVIDVVTAFKLNGVNIDSVFYVFENFKQTFIEDNHLKGRGFADVSLEMSFDEKLKLFQETLIADIGVTIKNGELNNFEPMKKLNKYLDEEGLSKLRFADLKNDIHIENKTIYIPQMEIKNNLTAIQLSGTHTFDQRIDYRLIAPLRNKKKIDPDEAFGAIEENEKGQMKVFLKILGTTDKYNISLDKQAVKKQIASDFKKEVQELKDAFKLKGKKKKKELELEKDDYFDWENN
jgi:hypothetical protein